MNRSTPGLPVHHQVPEFAQTHVHWVGDAIQHLILCHPLPLLPSIFPSIRVFSSESVLRIKWSKQCLHLPFVGFLFHAELKDIVNWIPWGRSMIRPQGCTIVSGLFLPCFWAVPPLVLLPPPTPFLTSTCSNLPFGTQGVSHRLESVPYKKWET